MSKTFSVQDFFRRFPDDAACLDHMFKIRFGPEPGCPKCGEIGRFRRLSKLPAYTCNCGHHLHPMAGTIFERSHTPLQKWFYAMYLFAMSRHGVPAKELQRQLSVTYKTAWRVGHQIRKYMSRTDGSDPLGGHVEIDETRIGGRDKGSCGPRDARPKTIVLGMLERKGKVMTRIVEGVARAKLYPHILMHVKPNSTISTDELGSYASLGRHGYVHGTVNHSREQWVDGIHHVNSIEGVWSHIKRSIRGTHVHVSRKHLWKYLGEFEYRFNMRHAPEAMFARLLLSF